MTPASPRKMVNKSLTIMPGMTNNNSYSSNSWLVRYEAHISLSIFLALMQLLWTQCSILYWVMIDCNAFLNESFLFVNQLDYFVLCSVFGSGICSIVCYKKTSILNSYIIYKSSVKMLMEVKIFHWHCKICDMTLWWCTRLRIWSKYSLLSLNSNDIILYNKLQILSSQIPLNS